MKALVYHGPGQRCWEGKPHRTLDKPTDAVVRIAQRRTARDWLNSTYFIHA